MCGPFIICSCRSKQGQIPDNPYPDPKWLFLVYPRKLSLLGTRQCSATAGRPRPGGGINLRDLLEENIISAGEDVLSVEYKGNVTYATLSPMGHILCMVSSKNAAMAVY